MSLQTIQRGRIRQPARIVIYGVDKVGKSTFGANAPSPIFLGAEKGTAQLDVARFPQPIQWTDMFEAIKVLGTQEHDYKTLVIDSLDWVEPLCHAWICQQEKTPVKNIDDISYGRGFAAALNQWRLLLSQLDRLSEKCGTNIVLIGHAQIKKFQNPSGEDFDRYELKLHNKASALVREWADCILFAEFETHTHETGGRVKGITNGARIVHCERTAAFDAGNRYGLPAQLPLGWQEFAAAVVAARSEKDKDNG